jgi:serine/threonine protein kinase
MKLQHASPEEDLPSFKQSVGVGMPYRYRTPELVEYLIDGTPPTTKSDLFQLGLVLAELFTGKNPQIAAESFKERIQMKPIGVIRGALGRGISNLIANMLELNPNDREPPAKLLDAWQGLFFTAAKRTLALEGAVF